MDDTKPKRRTAEEQVAFEEGELAHLEQLVAEGLSRKESVLKIVEIVMSRLDGFHPIARGLMRARLLDRIEQHPAFAELGRLDWPGDED